MVQVNLAEFAAADLDYVEKLNSNGAILENATNSHSQQLLSSVGPGADLILRVFDRDGIVGRESYWLDVENYVGGVIIDIGRRPAPDPLRGEVDTSYAWGTFGGTKDLVQVTGDTNLDASAIIAGIPKTIYVGIPAGGVPNFFEDTLAANIIYIYSMTYDGFSFSNIRRRAHILPGYETLKEMAAHARSLQVYDPDTDWIDGPPLQLSDTEIVTFGDEVDNAIGVLAAVEVIGFFVSIHKSGDDHWNAPTGNPPDSNVKLKVVSAALDWTGEMEIDAGQVPDTVFALVLPAVGDLKYVTEVRRFNLELVSVGSAVTSARGMTWGLIYRPLIGAPVPKDDSVVGMI